MQIDGYIIGRLATHGQNDPFRLLELVNGHDGLEGQLLKVELVRHVVVGADRLRVVVDHDGFVAELLELVQAADGAPVELDRAPDAVHAAAEHDDGAFVEVAQVVLAPVVRQVQIVGLARPFRAHGIDLFDEWEDVELGSDHADLELGAVDVHCYLFVRKAELFYFEKQLGAQD